MYDVLFITDLKLDDNLAIEELLNTMKTFNIKVNIDIIVTSINNFDKLINNLLLHSTAIKKYVENGSIRFYKGEQTYEKRHEITIDNTNYKSFKLKTWEYILESKLNKYTICFGFAPIYTFTYSNLFNKCCIAVIGHGFNTIHLNNDGNFDNLKTKYFLEKLKNDTELILYINNYATFNKSLPGGRISINNIRLINLLKSMYNGEELILQSIKDGNLFVRDQLSKLIVNGLNNNDMSKIIISYYKDITLYNKDKIKNMILDDLNEIIFNNNKQKMCQITDFVNQIILYLENNEHIIEELGIKYTYIKLICSVIMDNINDPKVEVTDWSQMILLLDIFKYNNFNGNIKGLKFNIDRNGVIFEENNEEKVMFYLTDITWSYFGKM